MLIELKICINGEEFSAETLGELSTDNENVILNVARKLHEKLEEDFLTKLQLETEFIINDEEELLRELALKYLR